MECFGTVKLHARTFPWEHFLSSKYAKRAVGDIISTWTVIKTEAKEESVHCEGSLNGTAVHSL